MFNIRRRTSSVRLESVIPFPPIFASDEEAARIYTACGKIAIFWGPVELAIERLLLLTRNRVGATVPFPLGFRKKRTALKGLLKADPVYLPVLDQLRQMLGRAKILHSLRCWVVHSICQGTDIHGNVMFGTSAQMREVAYTSKLFTLEELERAAADMRTLREEFERALDLLRTIPKPS